MRSLNRCLLLFVVLAAAAAALPRSGDQAKSSRSVGAAPVPHIRILFGGDSNFGESYQDEYAKRGAGNILLEKGYDYSLAHLSRLLRSVDYRILNLETPLTLHRDSPLKGKDFIHYSDPVKAPSALGRFGPIAYSLANNHTLDQGEA